MWRIRERMVWQAAHQHELDLSRGLRRRPKKTRCVETLGLFEKSLAACQWKRGWSRPHCLNNMAARWICWGSCWLPRMMLFAQRGWHSVKGGEGNCGKEALARGLIYLFLTCGGSLNNIVTLLHNHQTSSMRIKPPLDVDSFRTDFNSHLPNRFRCRRDKSGSAPHLHLWMRIDAHYFC